MAKKLRMQKGKGLCYLPFCNEGNDWEVQIATPTEIKILKKDMV